LTTTEYYFQRIINQPECVRSSFYELKIQMIQKKFLVVLEDYLRISYWSDDYDMNTSYLCFEIFKDYYTDPEFRIDRTISIDEEIWLNFVNCMQILSTREEEAFDPVLLDNVSQIIDQKEFPFAIFKVKRLGAKTIPPSPIVKFTKRENIDKRVLRQFRKFLICQKDKTNLSEFWKTFVNVNLLPPVKYTNHILKEDIDFKSFNINYSIWLFSHRGGCELYKQFLTREMEKIMNMFKDVVKKSYENGKELRNYIENLAFIYSTGMEVSEVCQKVASKECNKM
jgi:hypothetical protein